MACAVLDGRRATALTYVKQVDDAVPCWLGLSLAGWVEPPGCCSCQRSKEIAECPRIPNRRKRPPSLRESQGKRAPADLAKEGFEKALANMRELAEITTQSQKEAFDVVRKRIEENVGGIRTFWKESWQMNLRLVPDGIGRAEGYSCRSG